jgi:hypothetical protein
MAGDELFFRENRPPTPPLQPQPGELLFEFHVERTHKFYRVELRDHGAYGVEAQFLDPIEPIICRTFHQRLEPTRTPREMAIAWAAEERKAIDQIAGSNAKARMPASSSFGFNPSIPS